MLQLHPHQHAPTALPQPRAAVVCTAGRALALAALYVSPKSPVQGELGATGGAREGGGGGDVTTHHSECITANA